MNSRKKIKYDYDVTLSFAGENRVYVRKVAKKLAELGVRAFFDEYNTIDLWGKDLYVHLQDVYKNSAKYCVIFISKNYSKKVWTNHERKSAQARAINQNAEYILPARFDNTEVPGLLDTIGYVDLGKYSPQKFADIINKKIGETFRENYFPPIPDLFYKRIKAKTKKVKYVVETRARDFFKVLERMNNDERFLIYSLFANSCPVELPENVHININLLHRITGFPKNKIIRILNSLLSLGFDFEITKGINDDEYHQHGERITLEWYDMSIDELVFGNATYEVDTMLKLARENLCDECALRSFIDLDFSQLASVTYKEENHK